MKTIASFGCGVDRWLKLRDDHKDLFEKSKELENNSTMKLPLITMKGKDSKTLFECACFNG